MAGAEVRSTDGQLSRTWTEMADSPRADEQLEHVIPLADPSTPLPAEAAVAVIGGGIMGISIAFHLTEAGVADVLYATGLYGHGFLQGPAVGEIVRDLILGQTPFVDVAPLAVERFARAAPRPERNVI